MSGLYKRKGFATRAAAKLTEETGRKHVVVEKDGGFAVVPEGPKTVVPFKYRLQYGPDQNCGDTVARLLSDYVRDENGKVDTDRLSEVANRNGVDLGKWSHLNLGMVRMNLGNVLRGRVRNGATVHIGNHTIGPVEKDEGEAL